MCGCFRLIPTPSACAPLPSPPLHFAPSPPYPPRLLLSSGSQLVRVSHGIGQVEGDAEGRVITAELGAVFVVNVYTPNSGEGLSRLAFRTDMWDQAFAAYVKRLEEIKPVVVIGETFAVVIRRALQTGQITHSMCQYQNPEPVRSRSAGHTEPRECSCGRLHRMMYSEKCSQ